MAKDFKKKLQDLLFPKPPEDSHHELVISPDDVVIGTETVKELNSDNPLQFRLAKVKEITSVVARKRLEEHAVEAIWVAVQDLVQPSNPLEVRIVVLTFLKALIQGQYDHLQLLRDHFFHVVATHNIEEDFGYRLDILVELTCNGRNVTCFEEEIGPLLLNWMPVMASHERLCDFLNLVVNIIHYNATYLDDQIITGLVVYACAICDRQEPMNVVMEACLTVFDSVLKYSCLPVNALHPVIFTLCHTVNRQALCPMSWQVVGNLLGTHLGERGIFILCSILEEEESAKDALLLKGAVYFLGMSLWGARKVSTLSHSYSSVLPSVKKALQSGHLSVVFEIVCSVDRLVRKYGQSLSLVTWDLITDILEVVAKHVENEVSLEDGSTIAQHLHNVCCYIEDLCDRNCFTGSKERFFSLVEKLTLKRPELCALTLVSFRAESIMITSPEGMTNLCSLMEKYYQKETRTNVRIKALDALSCVLSACRYTFEDEIIEVVVLPYLLPVHQDKDMAVHQSVTQLLVDLAYDCNTPHFFIIIDAIKRVANRELTELRDQGTDGHNVNDNEVNSEMEDVKAAVAGLISLFKWKLMHLPSTHCYCIYQSLIDHVQLQYQRHSLSRHESEIRQKVFQCLLQLRSDGYHHLGYVKEDGTEAFSNFVMCDGSSIDLSEEKRSIRLPSSSSSSSPPPSQSPAYNPINFIATFNLLLICLQQELDKMVMMQVLEMLPAVLRNRNLILSCNADLNTLSRVLCAMVGHQGVSDVSSPGRQSRRRDVTEYIYPVLYVVAMYPRQLERKHKHDLIKCIESGVRSRSSHAAIISLSQCCMEMQIVMTRLLPSVLATLSQLSATVALSLPVLEFLSNLSCLDETFKGFHESQYRAVFATALPYTDPSKFSVQVVYLAYHTIFTWFVKSPLSHRKVLVKFILKGLYRSAGVSPTINRQGIDIHLSQPLLKSPKPARHAGDVGGSDVGGGGVMQHDEMVERVSLHKVKSVCEVSFHDEMREVCHDLMLRYTYANCFTQPRRSALASSLVNGGQAKHWLVGNTIVTITTSSTHIPSTTSVGSTRGLTPSLSREDSAASSSQHSPVRSSSLFSGGDSWPCPATYDVSQCQGWAEVLVRRPTGNMAWMMKMENKQQHHRKSLPISIFSSSTGGLQQDDLTALSSHTVLGSFGLTPQSTLHSTGYLHHSLRQRTPVSMLSPIQQVFSATDVISDTYSEDTMIGVAAETDRNIFELDSLSANRQAQQKDSTVASIPARRSRRQLDFPKPSLGVSPFDHEHVMSDHHKSDTPVDGLKSHSFPAGTHRSEEVAKDSSEVSSLRSESRDNAMDMKLCRYDSCPQLASIEGTNIQSSRSFNRQHSKEAEDVLVSPTSPHLDKTHLSQYRAPILPLTFSCPQWQMSGGSSLDDFHDPSFLFLQLYGQVFLMADGESQPILLPKSDFVDRSLKVMDHLQPYNTHKIGVVYISKGQHNETSILSNESGSSNYFQFLSGLGKLIRLSDCHASDVYLGGLSQTGEDGQFAYIWTNEVSQVVFHVATLMTNKVSDPQCHAKKRHIGNDFVKIVFNESGDKYQPETIKAQFNLVDIVIDALSEESYQVTVHTKPGVSPPIADAFPRIISNDCLPLLVRQMALHADLSCMAHHSEKGTGDHVMSNWIERLKKVKHLYSKMSGDKSSDAAFTDYT